MSVLEKLYSGNIAPSEKYLKKEGEYHRINQKLTEYIDELSEALNDKERALCEKIGEKIYALGYIAEKECFIEGFCLGSQIMLEVMHYESKNYS